MGKRTSVLVERESAEAYKQSLADAIYPEAVAQILGIGRKAVVDLVAHSCLPAFRGRSVDGYSGWLIHRDAPVGLLSQIDSFVKEIAGMGITDECSFDLVIRKLSGSGCSIGLLVRAILNDKLVPSHKIQGTGLKQYCFNTKDIDRLVGEYYVKDEQFLNVLDIAALLGVKQQVAAFWIDRGFIPAETKVGKHRHRQVLRTSIEEFCLKYVTAAELARSIGSSPRNVICLLGKQNILPVTGKDIDGGRQYLFLRMDATAALKDLGSSLTC